MNRSKNALLVKVVKIRRKNAPSKEFFVEEESEFEPYRSVRYIPVPCFFLENKFLCVVMLALLPTLQLHSYRYAQEANYFQTVFSILITARLINH